MAFTREELSADLVWRYVEHLREDGLPLTERDLRRLEEALRTASQVPAALADQSPDTCRAEVRARVEAHLTTVSTMPAAAPSPDRQWGFSLPRLLRLPDSLPAWRFAAAAALAALAVGLGTVNVWHRPAPEVREVRVTVPVQDVEPIEEAQVHAFIHRMMRNELAPREEKSLMWHMLVCPGCFDEYVEIKRLELPHHTADGLRREVIRLAGR